MSKILGFASTPYQLLVFLFIKDAYLSQDEVDLVITDKTPSMEKLYQRGNLKEYFHQIYFADGRKIKNPYKNPFVTFLESFIYNPTTNQIMDKPLQTYDQVYFASPGLPDEIVKEVAKTLIRKNKKLIFHRFEDGFASYTKKTAHVINTELGIKMYKKLWNYDVEKMERDMFMFEPDMAEKTVNFEKIKIEQTPERIQKITEIAKKIFQFQANPPAEEFIFLGQGTVNGMENAETYQKLILKLQDIIGREHFTLKPHPRGEHDNFQGAIKIYQDSCPFELAIASGEFENKTLISFYSTACVSGKLLFQSNCRIIFLYPLSEDSFNEKCDYEDYFSAFSSLCDNVFIARTWEDVQRLCQSH